MLKNAFNSDISDPRKLERKAKEKVPITNIFRQTKRTSFLLPTFSGIQRERRSSSALVIICGLLVRIAIVSIPMTLSALVSVVGCGV